ncbi:MAG: PIG-L family deacetylase [Verrucomicrobia bacterium]|nr:MAG: PIG-L family deacetylase [Verrucomicrobiota bacterium]
MQNQHLTRRRFVKHSLAVAGPALLAANALPLAAAEGESGAARKLKVVCVGGHPDDPESGCAGTLTRYAELGHALTVIYLTRGERGISGKSLDEAARIRSAECEAACKIMGAKPVFFGQIDGATELNKTHVDAMTKLLTAENPDVLFTHWPIDTHMDHQVASFLTIRAWMALRKPQLYFFEVNSGSQTEGFLPNTYVDISSLVEKKSQDGEGIWRQHHEVIANWRGREAGVSAAEAFVHLSRDSQTTKLPGV